MGLLRADLQSLANLPTSPGGRRVAFGTAFGLGLLALMSWWLANEILARPQLLQYVHGEGAAGSLRALLGSGLMPCPIAATWLGLALAQRQLFESPELLLWRQAPLPGWRPAVQVLLRAGFVAMCWTAALAGPFVVTLLRHAGAPWFAHALVPVAFLACTMPLLCTLLAVQVVLVRFFAGRLLRLLFALLAALASVGFSTWLLLGMFTPGSARLRDLANTAASTERLPWTIDTASALLAAAAEGRLDRRSLAAGLGWLAAALAIFGVAARLHPGAVERHLLAEPPLWRRAGRAWPASLAGTIRRKEFAQVLQQPGALIAFLVFALLVFAMARERMLVGGMLANWRLPRDVAHLGAMLTQWFLAVLLVLYAHMGRLALWDGAQWSLYMTAPASPGAILCGKLQAIALFLLWPLVLVAAAGSHLLEASPAALATFAGMALGGTLVALGVLVVVGTSPRLMRPDEGGHIAQGGRSFFAAMLLVLLFELAVSPAVFGWLWLVDHLKDHTLPVEAARDFAPWLVLGAFVLGLCIGSLGLCVGIRNYRRLLQGR